MVQKKPKFAVGQKVVVVRKAKSGERGWTNTWESPEMYSWVGKVCTIDLIDGNDIGLKRRGIGGYGFPDFVLRPATKKEVVNA